MPREKNSNNCLTLFPFVSLFLLKNLLNKINNTRKDNQISLAVRRLHHTSRLYYLFPFFVGLHVELVHFIRV